MALAQQEPLAMSAHNCSCVTTQACSNTDGAVCDQGSYRRVDSQNTTRSMVVCSSRANPSTTREA
eukprot:1160054-Pelagomonas_calceolata.AAC.8